MDFRKLAQMLLGSGQNTMDVPKGGVSSYAKRPNPVDAIAKFQANKVQGKPPIMYQSFGGRHPKET